MSSYLGPIEIACDAPPHSIVVACKKLGFEAPLDVRWCRMSCFITGQHEPSGLFGFYPLSWLFGKSQPPRTTCTCGHPLPLMEDYTYVFASTKKAHYLMGQYYRCRTIFWEEASGSARYPSEPGRAGKPG